MGLKETVRSMHILLEHISKDLKKSERGNKAASQRVRTGTIKLAKTAKTYRKESIMEERKLKKAKKEKSRVKAKRAKKKSHKKRR